MPAIDSMIERITHSPEETTELGREIASRLSAPVLVLLSGDLGSGKTTLTKGIVSGLGAAREEDVTSPTFTLVHVFQKKSTHVASSLPAQSPDERHGKMTRQGWSQVTQQSCRESSTQAQSQAQSQVQNQPKIYHVDLYRIENFQGLESLGLEDALADPAILIIEWSERFSLRSDWPRLRIHLEHLEGDSRRITIIDTPAND